MKKLLLGVTFTLGLGLFQVHAQSIEIIPKAGINIAKQAIKDVNGEKSKVGFQGGVGVNIHTKIAGFSIQPELNFVQKGSEINGKDGRKIDYNTSYLELPVLAKYSIGPLFVNAGPAIGLRLSDSNKAKEAIGKTKSIDFGVQMGLGAALPVGPGKVIVDGRYNLGLTNVSDVSNRNIKNRGILVSLGYAIPLGN
ncbi:MAG: PorT family protein [Sphingobacterium sp.]|jgi:hypothetical protein|nr:PorT family protein [Sphingobacterium sp.]